MDIDRVKRLVVVVILLSMAWSAGLVVLAASRGGGDWLAGMRSTAPSIAFATLVFFAVNHGLRFLRWHLLLRAEGYRVPWLRSLSIFMAGLALQPTPAKAGVAARSVLLQGEGVPVHVSLAAYFAERLLDLVGLLVLATVLLAQALPAQRLWILGGAVAAAVVLVAAAPRLAGIAHRWSASRPSAPARAVEWAMRFFIDAAGMIAGWRFAAFVILGMLANIATGWFLWYALGDASGAIDPVAGVGILAVSHLSGSISMLPGGLGGFELAMLAQLAAMGVPDADAVRSLALVRVVTLWGSVAVGLPLLWAGMRRVTRGGA